MVSTVHPSGIPFTPVVQIEGSGQTNVPVGDTLEVQLFVEKESCILVARHFI